MSDEGTPAAGTASGWAGDQGPRTYWGEAEPQRPPPPPGTAYAGVGRRFIAWLIDIVPMLLLLVVVMWPIAVDFLGAVVDAAPGPRASQAAIAEFQTVMLAAFEGAMPGLLRASALLQVGALLYFAGCWLVFSRTPGMALFGLRIVPEEGGRLGVARIVVRYSAYLVGAGFFLIGLIAAVFDGRRQAWHDKLAGTLVVQTMADRSPASPDVAGSTPVARRPSIGALAESAWGTLWRAPGRLLAVLAFVLVPTILVHLPLFAAVLVLQQDQAIATLQGMNDLLRFSSDPSTAAAEYNLRALAATAPTYLMTAVIVLVGGVLGSLLLGACAAAIDGSGAVQSAGTVTRATVARLPALLALGLLAGVATAAELLLLGLPAISAATTETSDAVNLGFVGIAALSVFVLTPVSLYLGAIWLLAVVCVVRENLGIAAGFRRAWVLSRRRMRWLVGIEIVVGLACVVVIAPLGTLPLGILAEAYLDGEWLPVALSVAITGLLTVLTAPTISLTFVGAYRAARDEAARVDPSV